MQKEKDKNNDHLLNTLSIKEIVDIFMQIDKKITSLHECSADDFLTINRKLKSYHQDAKTISSNSSRIFDLVSGQDQKDLYANLQSFHNQLKNESNIFEALLDQSLDSLHQISTNINLMTVPFKNFKQNLMTIRYLEVNRNLKITTPGDKKEQVSNELEDLLLQLNKVYSQLDKKLITLKDSISSTRQIFDDNKETGIFNLENLLNDVQISINLLEQKHKESLIQAPKLKDTTESYFNSINRIITSLQYHDIIRQKMEHIQETHQEIIQELNEIDKSEDEELTKQKQVRCFIKIRDIAHLQVAQLIRTNREYENAIETITKKLIEIGKDMTKVASICKQYSADTQKSDQSHFEEIGNKLESIFLFLQQFQQANQNLILKVKEINTATKDIFITFKKIQEIKSHLQHLMKRMINRESGKKFSDIVKQLEKLILSISTINEKLHKLFDNNLAISDLMQKRLGEYQEKHSPHQRVETSNKIKNVLQSFKQNNTEVDNRLLEISTLGNTISDDIKSLINNVKYYDFFEKVIEEIIHQLNEINAKLEEDQEKADILQRIANMQQMEMHYTTKSEREVHENVLKNEDEDLDVFDQDKIQDEEDDDNLELF